MEMHADDNSSAAEGDTGADDDVSTTTFRESAGRCARLKRRNCFLTVVRLTAVSFLPMRLRSVLSLFDMFSL
jgi:hypothetical protein